MGEFVAHPHGLEDIGRLQAGGGAGRPGGDGHTVHGQHQRFSLHAGEADVEAVGEPALGMPVQVHVVQLGEEPLLEPVPQSGQAPGLFGHDPAGNLTGLAEAHDARHVEGAGAQPLLVPTAVDLRRHPDPGMALPDVQGADPLGTVDLVRGEGHQVDSHRLHVDGNLAHRLGRVAVEEDALLPGDPPDLRHGVDGPHLVVGRHDGNQDRPLRDRRQDIRGRDEAVAIHRKAGDLVSQFLEPGAAVQHRLVLGAAGDDVPSLPVEGLRDAEEGQVVRLGRSAGEDDLPRSGVNQGRHRFPGLLHRLLGPPAEGVASAGGVSELPGEKGEHRLQHFGIDRSGGLVIHVDGLLSGHCRHGDSDFPQRHPPQHVNDLLIELDERAPHAALLLLPAGPLAGASAVDERDRTLDGLHDLAEGDGGGVAGRRIASLGAVLGDEDPLPGQGLEQLGQDFERDVVGLGDLPGAGGLVLLGQDVLEGHQAVIGLLAQAKHGSPGFSRR